MKILSPISRKEEVEPLIAAGAGELYCGIVPRQWSDRYSVFDTLNRREGYGANFSNFTDLQYAIRLAHKRNVPVFVTMNGLYTREQYSLIREIVEKLINIRVDGLIIADLGLLLMLRKTKFPGEIHMGTGGTAFNSRTISFYKKLGASRIILDRHLTIGEIKDISQKSSSIIDLEVFILNSFCQNVDGFCTFYHGIHQDDIGISQEVDVKNKIIKFLISYDIEYEGHGCSLKYAERIFDNKGKKVARRPILLKNSSMQDKNEMKGCGACAIFDFIKMKIATLKIVERGMSTDNKVRSAEFIRGVLDIPEKERNISKESFIRKVQALYSYAYKYNECSGFSCHYPSVFHKNVKS